MDMTDDPPERASAEWYRRRTLFALRQLETTVPEISSPKFVFAHLVIPHHPFVFGPNGEELNSIEAGVPKFEEYKVKYPDQVRYINKRILAIVDLILRTSPKPPIIIIQGDHGPDFWSVRTSDETIEEASWDIAAHRMRILNAYYFPDNSSGLYESITPVNSFRLVFNKYFGKDYEMLEDVSRFSHFGKPYDFKVIPPSCSE
jgi:hypothetical protein